MNVYFSVLASVVAITSPSLASVAFSDFDLDKDNLISLEEARINESFRTAFAVLDINEDGMINALEFKGYEHEYNKS